MSESMSAAESAEEVPPYSPRAPDYSSWSVTLNTYVSVLDLVLPLDMAHAALSYEAFQLKPQILNGIYASGFERPSPLDERVISPILHGCDVIAEVPSHRDVYAAFAIPILEMLDMSSESTQVVILSPTAELAQEIRDVFEELGRELDIAGRIQILSTTTNEFLARYEAGEINVKDIRHMCLAEADILLFPRSDDKDFDTQRALRLLPEGQITMFSTIMSPEALAIAEPLLQNPVRISVTRGDERPLLDGITHIFLDLHDKENRLDALCTLHEKNQKGYQAIVYCNTGEEVDRVVKALSSRGVVASAVHCDLPTELREQLGKDFNSGSTRYIVTTLRSIYTDNLNVRISSDAPPGPPRFFINFDMPTTPFCYTWRIVAGPPRDEEARDVIYNFITCNDDLYTLQGIDRAHYFGSYGLPIHKITLEELIES